MLIGGLSAGMLAGCDQVGNQPPPVSAGCVYTNNHYVPGVGYYHAPFRAFYSLPYNHFDAQRKSFFYGGQWSFYPHQSITNISPPTAQVVQQAEAQRTDVPRSGFGSSSRSHSVWS